MIVEHLLNIARICIFIKINVLHTTYVVRRTSYVVCRMSYVVCRMSYLFYEFGENHGREFEDP